MTRDYLPTQQMHENGLIEIAGRHGAEKKYKLERGTT